MGEFWFGFVLLFALVLVISFFEYRNGGESIFFKDKTEIEKLKRENQKLEEKIRNIELKKRLEDMGE